jgi:hypothetical protein
VRVIGEVEHAGVEAEVDNNDVLAINGALSWICNGVQSSELDREFEGIIGLDRVESRALLARIHGLSPVDGREVLALAWSELIAIRRALALTLDGPFSEDVHTLTGVGEDDFAGTLESVDRIIDLAS